MNNNQHQNEEYIPTSWELLKKPLAKILAIVLILVLIKFFKEEFFGIGLVIGIIYTILVLVPLSSAFEERQRFLYPEYADDEDPIQEAKIPRIFTVVVYFVALLSFPFITHFIFDLNIYPYYIYLLGAAIFSVPFVEVIIYLLKKIKSLHLSNHKMEGVKFFIRMILGLVGIVCISSIIVSFKKDPSSFCSKVEEITQYESKYVRVKVLDKDFSVSLASNRPLFDKIKNKEADSICFRILKLPFGMLYIDSIK